MHVFLSLTFIALASVTVIAHTGHHGHNPGGVFIVLCLIAAGAALAILRQAWRNSRATAAASALIGIAASIGLAAIYAAVGEAPFTRHMLEQLVLMDVAAPLIAAVAMTRFRVSPAWAAAAHAVLMWGWHIPTVYAGTSSLPGLHIAMQVSFLLVGIAFWSSILRARGRRAGHALFWLFMTVMHTGFLGALLTFTEQPLYGAAISDQQLGGVVMWVMGTTIYAVAGLLVAARWFDALERGAFREHAA